MVVRYSVVSTEVKEGVTVTKLYLKNMFRALTLQAYIRVFTMLTSTVVETLFVRKKNLRILS